MGEQVKTSTIAALATAPQPAGIAVVRVSGPRAHSAVHAIFRGKKDPTSVPRMMVYGDLLNYESGNVIDKTLCVFMPGPHSFTGEDTAEFQFHGGALIIEKVLRSLFSCGVIPAEAGEFTKRAFLNGKLDLVQAEAIADVISATSDRSLKIASEQLSGKLSRVFDEIGEPLKNALAEIEAGIDFPEEDISPDTISRIRFAIAEAQQKIAQSIESYQYGQVIREGFRVLLCGRPNAGKSSLLNLLLGRQRAIVTSVEGTTRDLIEESCVLGGYSFVFCDSAGLRDTEDEVEKIGIALTKKQLAWADLVLLITDASDESNSGQDLAAELSDKAPAIWMVVNKIDLNPSAVGTFFCESNICRQNVYLSAKTKDGLSGLVAALIDEVKQRAASGAEAGTVVTNERHINCLQRAASALEAALAPGLLPEIMSVDLRDALGALGELVGKTTTEDILGRIFSKFCIGK